MAKSPNQKLKLLHLYKILSTRSDEEHPFTVQELIAELSRHDIKAERKSIYDDMEALRSFGLDVQSRKGKSPGWFVGQREFELAELKLLVDAVQSSRFITQKKSNALIRKLEGLASTHQARQLHRQVYVSQRVKLMNESIYYTVDKLHAAIAENRAITFRYFDYTMHREKAYRRQGGRYAASPFGLIWNNENYYLVAYESASQQMRHYRVDKMSDITLTPQPREGGEKFPNFDLAAYGQKHFGMFSGQEATVTLRCRSHMAGVVLDRFGHDVILIPQDEAHFSVTLPVVLSPQFFGWLFGLEDNVVLTAPQWAADAYKQKLSAVSDLY